MCALASLGLLSKGDFIVGPDSSIRIGVWPAIDSVRIDLLLGLDKASLKSCIGF